MVTPLEPEPKIECNEDNKSDKYCKFQKKLKEAAGYDVPDPVEICEDIKVKIEKEGGVRRLRTEDDRSRKRRRSAPARRRRKLSSEIITVCEVRPPLKKSEEKKLAKTYQKLLYEASKLKKEGVNVNLDLYIQNNELF